MLRIALFCSQGMSTSLLGLKMKAAGEKMGYELKILAFPVTEMEQRLSGVDCALLAPQMGFMNKHLEDICKPYNIPFGVIPIVDYGNCDGAGVFKLALRLIEGGFNNA